MNRAVTIERIFELTNEKTRKAFLSTWPEWPVLVRINELQMQVHEVVLPGGSRFTASCFGGDTNTCILGMHKAGNCYLPYETANSHLVGHLTKLRKDLAALPAEERITQFPVGSNTLPESKIILCQEERTLSKEEICALKNEKMRLDFLRTYETWPVLVEVPILNMKVNKLHLPDGCGIIVTTYGQSYSAFYYLLSEGEVFSPQNKFTTGIVTHLQTLCTGYRREKKQAAMAS